MEANWTDPLLFFIYSVAKPVLGGADPGRHARHRQRRRRTPSTARSSSSGPRCGRSSLAGIAGLAWSVLDDRERYRMLKYVYVSPSDFLVILLGRGVARVARRRDGRGHHDRVRRPPPRRAVRSGRRRLAAARRRHGPRARRRSSPSGSCSPRSASRRGRSRGHYPEAVGGRPVPRQRRRLPVVGAAASGPGARAADAADLVDRGRPPRDLPGRHVRRSADPDSLWTTVTGTAAPDPTTDRRRLAGRPGRWLHSPPPASSGRASAARRIAGCWTRRLAPDGGSTRMRIYEGSPRQDFEEVFRSIGAFIDQRGMQRRPARRGARRLHRPGPGHSGPTAAPGRDSMGTLRSRRP